MSFGRIAGVLCVLFSINLMAETIPLEEYRARRAGLQKKLDGTVILFGKTEGGDDVYQPAQEANFYYLTGWSEPGAVLIVTKTEDALFLPHASQRSETFTGHKASAADANIKEVTGFSQVLPIEKLESFLLKAIDSGPGVYALTDDPKVHKLSAFLQFRELASARPLVAELRARKSKAEIGALQHSADVTVEGHRAAWKRMQAGLYEYQLSATMTDVFLEAGCEGHAYSPIVGSGHNGTVLHYSANNRRMDRGEVVVMDVAAECDHYASNVTRTIPVSGKFTPRQRELYEIVLGAQKAAISAIKPGVRMGGEGETLNKIAHDYINSHGKDLHGEPLGKYFVHGLGHPVGIDVHDPQARGALEAGMVVTIEPGIYIPEENIGIRIEDVVLVTENGARILSGALPREADDVEKALAR